MDLCGRPWWSNREKSVSQCNGTRTSPLETWLVDGQPHSPDTNGKRQANGNANSDAIASDRVIEYFWTSQATNIRLATTAFTWQSVVGIVRVQKEIVQSGIRQAVALDHRKGQEQQGAANG